MPAKGCSTAHRTHNHRSITSTAVYTTLPPNRFKDFWRGVSPVVANQFRLMTWKARLPASDPGHAHLALLLQ